MGALERSEALRMHRNEVIKQQSCDLYYRLVREARKAIQRHGRNAESIIEFQDGMDPLAFGAINLVYPMIKTEVRWAVDAIRFTTIVRESLDSDPAESSGKLVFGLDAADKLTLSYNDAPVLSVDDALHIILDPVFRIPPVVE